MAGLFGGNAAMAMGGVPMSWSDRLALLGAGLKDASPGSGGGNLQAAQQMMFQRQMFQRQQQMLSGLPGLFGGQAAQATGAQELGPQTPVMTDAGSGPTMKGPGEDGSPIGPAETAPTYAMPQAAPAPASSGPDWQRIAASAPLYKALGIDIGSPADYLKLGQPHLMVTPSGEAINDKDASMAGKIFPKIENGQIVLRDARGNPMGVMNLPGAAFAAAQTAGATSNAQEAAKAAYDLVPVQQSDGSTRLMPRSMALAAMTGQGGAPGGGTGGATPGGPALGVSQTPAAAELAKARAATQGKNEMDIAGAHSAMQQVDDQTNMIAQNLHDMLGETQDPNTGKWVKTKPSMIRGGLMPSAGSATDLVEHIPFVNQPAKDLQAKMETVRNGTSFNSLQAIKGAMAAAGDGGSGSIRMTDQTARMLGEINGSLNQDQSPAQLEATVRRHLSQLDQLSKDRHALFASQYQGIRPTTPGQTGPTANYTKPSSGQLSPPQPGDVRKGYRFVGGDPRSPQSWAKVQ